MVHIVRLLGIAAIGAPALAQPGTSARIPDAPLVSIGANEEFAGVTSAAFLVDGAVLVADARNARVSVFGATGRLERTIGRAGAGPGEFGNLAWARPYGRDSIATYDHSQRRVTIFSRSGGVGRTAVMMSPKDGWAPEALVALGDGRFIVKATRTVVAEASPPGVQPRVSEIWMYTPSGAPHARLTADLISEEWVRLTTPNLLMPRPFASVALIVASNAAVFVADSSDLPIRVIAPDGREARRIGTRSPSRVSSDAHIAAYRENRVAQARASSAPDALVRETQLLDAIPFPPRIPVIRRMFVDHDGRLWVQDFPAPRASRGEYRVFDADGRLAMRVTAPERSAILDVRGDDVLVAWQDPDGVPHVRVHRMSSGR